MSSLNSPYLIVGLGNPGKEYQWTRHNTGFLLLDVLAKRWGLSFSSEARFQAELARGETTILMKPQTYVNESGRSLEKFLSYYKKDFSLLVISDDVDLDFGDCRLRKQGGSGGHNGLKSIAAHIKGAIPRLRLGVGRGEGELSNHVLSPFSTKERGKLDLFFPKMADLVEKIIDQGMDAAWNACSLSQQKNKETLKVDA